MATVEYKDCAPCSKSVNNKFFNCPMRMQYGFMTQWSPRCTQDYIHLKNAPFNDSLSQRMYLQQNAEDLMAKNAQEFYNMMNCPQCSMDKGFDAGTMLPEQTTQTCDSRVCQFRTNDPFGLGFGRNYWSDDQEVEAKKAFVEAKTKEAQYFKNVSTCCGTQQDNVQYYPIDGNIKSQYPRQSVPGGGVQLSGGDRLMYPIKESFNQGYPKHRRS
jgi:hypothetical protein